LSRANRIVCQRHLGVSAPLREIHFTLDAVSANLIRLISRKDAKTRRRGEFGFPEAFEFLMSPDYKIRPAGVGFYYRDVLGFRPVNTALLILTPQNALITYDDRYGDARPSISRIRWKPGWVRPCVSISWKSSRTMFSQTLFPAFSPTCFL